MIPFEIELWKAGEPVITRDGQEVKELTYFESRKSTHKLVGTVNGHLETWLPEGYFINKEHQADYDLFHPEPEMWVNVYDFGDQIKTSRIFDSEHEAKAKILLSFNLIGTYKLIKP